ncbi:DUF5805 domain-containing protein [Halorubellus litoreus]|uniref:DUF5805 domain-containing protein n=1 Tax=Halorubellus litoreus TaxID=755308 RepID=A0ABD5VDQ2_9EURY
MQKEYSPITIRVEQPRRDDWESDMDDKGIESLAEYIRVMVEAGRHQFDDTSPFETDEQQSLRQKIEDELTTDSFRSWDDLMDPLIDRHAQEVERVLRGMKEAGKIEHSPSRGGWKLHEQ